MGEKMTTALASACAAATVNAVKAVRSISSEKTMRHLFSAAAAMITVCVFSIAAYAETEGGGGGEQVANQMITQIKTWVGIIAGVVIVFGAVNAGLGVANQDDAGRNRGFMTMAGGAIMEAVVQLV